MISFRSRPRREPIQRHPRVTCMAATYAEWAAKAQAHYQAEYGHLGEHQRSVFDMLGQKIYLETYFPWSFLESIHVQTIAADFTIREGSPTMALAARFGAHWEEGYYMDPGYGWPVFPGDDGTERCFAFLTEWRRLRPGQKEHPDRAGTASAREPAGASAPTG